MISLIKTVIRIIFLSAFVYAAFFSIYTVKEGQLGIVKDIESGEIVDSFSNDINFIRNGLLPWIYRIETVPAAGSLIIELKVPVTPAIVEEGNAVFLLIPLEIVYTINRKAPPVSDFFMSEDKRKEFFEKRALLVSRSVFNTYLDPLYNRTGIIRDEAALFMSISSGLKNSLAGSGLTIDSINSAGSMHLPSTELYRESLLRDSEIRGIAFENKKQELLLKNKLAKDRISTDIYYENLARMGGIIKDNPEILKYIYIDKLADNIKVIVSSEKSGFPVIFGQDHAIKESDLKKEIDNLR